MPIDFPNSPTNGDTYSAGGKNWQYNGTSWVLLGIVPTVPANSVDHSQLVASAVIESKIASSAVTESKIANNAITTAKIAAGAVVEADLATDAVTAAKIASNAVTAAKIASNAVTTEKLGTDVQLGYRNRIINGAFEVWQRGTAVQYNAGQGAYAADRWCGSHQFQGSRTQRTTISSPPSGLRTRYAIRVSSSTTSEIGIGTRMRLVQKVESFNSIPLRGQNVTLSFWVRFSAATLTSVANSTDSSYANFSYAINYYTSNTDSATHTNAGDSSTGATITNGSLPTTWTKYTLTGVAPSTMNNIEVLFGFQSLGSTASADTNWYEISQVQLEEGAIATPFEFEDYSLTLQKCYRYFYDHVLDFMGPRGFSSTDSYFSSNEVHFPVPMRATPSITVFDLVNAAGKAHVQYNGSGGGSNQTVTVVRPTPVSFAVGLTIAPDKSGAFYFRYRAAIEL